MRSTILKFLILLCSVVLVLPGHTFAERSGEANINHLLEQCRKHIEAKEYEQAIPITQRLMAALWGRSAFSVRRFTPVTREAESFGDIAARETYVYKLGEPLRFYVEPRHYDLETDGKSYAFSVAVDFEVRTTDGGVLASKKDFLRKDYTFTEPVFDLYLNIEVSLSGAPAGEYELIFVFKDLTSNRQTQATHRIKLQ